MIGLLVFGALVLSLFAASWTLVRLYRTHVEVGSALWNAHQVALREDLAKFSSRAASAQEVREFEAKEQVYLRRLELQYEKDVFADEVERLRAERLGQERRLEATQAYDALKRDAY